MKIVFEWDGKYETIELTSENAVKVAEMAKEFEAIEEIVRRNK